MHRLYQTCIDMLLIAFVNEYRRPMHTFYQVLCNMHLDRGNADIRKLFSYDSFRLAWLAFLKLLDIDFATGFTCPICSKDGSQPNLIVCDGTSLSFQRWMWQWKVVDSGQLGKTNASQTRLNLIWFLNNCLQYWFDSFDQKYPMYMNEHTRTVHVVYCGRYKCSVFGSCFTFLRSL